MMRNSGRAVFVGLLVLSSIAGGAIPAGAQDASSPASKVVLNVGQTSDVTSLNPFNLCCSWDYSYLPLVYDLAFGYGPDLSPAPSIITRSVGSPDHLTWTLTVRNDATWHDGEPVTAEDVAFSLSLVADNQMPFYKDYLPFEPTFEVVDDHTVLWKSTEPTFAPEIPAYIPVVPEHVWGRFVTPGDPKATRTAIKEFPDDPPIGSGPFELTEWKRGQFLRFEANPDYWDGAAASVDEIVITIYNNQEAMAQALRSGEIDYASGFGASVYDAVTTDPAVEGHVADGAFWNDIAFNFGGQGKSATNHEAIQDVTVRQAVELSIDKQEIVDKVYRGLATVGDSILMPGRSGYWYHRIPDDLRFSYDPVRSNQLLDDAGYLDTDGDGVREMPGGGDSLIWEIMTISDVNGSVETGQLLKGYLKEIGVAAELFTVNQAKASDVWLSGDWDAYVWGWGLDPDPDFILSVFTSEQCLGWSDGCYSNPEYDAMYAEQRTLFERDERKALIDRMQELLAEEIPTIVLNYQTSLEAYRNDRFTGFVKTPDVPSGSLLLSAYDTRSVRAVVPVSAEAAAPVASRGLPGWAYAVAVAAVVLVIAIVMLARRRAAQDEG